MLSSHAKRAVFQVGTTELYTEPASPRIAFVQLLLGRARSGRAFLVTSLHEQRSNPLAEGEWKLCLIGALAAGEWKLCSYASYPRCVARSYPLAGKRKPGVGTR